MNAFIDDSEYQALERLYSALEVENERLHDWLEAALYTLTNDGDVKRAIVQVNAALNGDVCEVGQ